jgi:hypothetical protein
MTTPSPSAGQQLTPRRTTTKVPASGVHTVTAACVGAPGAKVSVGQEHPGSPFRPTEPALDCAGATQAVDAAEEMQENARPSLLPQGRAARPLKPAQVARLTARRTTN